MLLKLLATSVVGCSYPKLQPLPCNGEGRIICIHVLIGHDVEGYASWLFLRFVFRHWRYIVDRRLPRDRDQLHRVTLDGLCGCDLKFLADYRNPNAIIHQDVAKAARQSYRPVDLKQVATVARKLWRYHVRVKPRGRRGIGHEEHAMQACIQ